MFNQAETIQPKIGTVPVEPMNVLILDNSEVDRKRLLRLCREAGLSMNATEAGTINEMQAALKETPFDIVFVDYLLTGADGLDAVELLMNTGDQSAVCIMIAGEARIDIAVEAMRRGCSDYLTKSTLSVESLQKSVATALERRMVSLALREERKKRQRLEQAVRRYADSASSEMRTILAGALRRVRKLRSLPLPSEHAIYLGDLEHSIDRLWDALPRLDSQADTALAPPEEETKAIMHHPSSAAREIH